MIQPSSPAWWAAVASLAGAIATIVWGPALGAPVQALVVALGGVIVLAYVRGYHATQIAETHAAAHVGAAKVQTDAIAAAVADVVRDHLAAGSAEAAAAKAQAPAGGTS